MTRSALCLVALLLAATPAFGQSATRTHVSGLWRNVSFAAASIPTAPATAGVTRSTPAQSVVERRGFTILVNVGLGVQHDTAFDSTERGLGGINLGVGGFVTSNLAILGRISGTTTNHPGAPGSFFSSQLSQVMGATVQYWLSDLFHIEAGGGAGYWSSDLDSEFGAGLILGTGVTVLDRGHHNLKFGAEYAPAFTDSATVHNFCITFGYQFHK